MNTALINNNNNNNNNNKLNQDTGNSLEIHKGLALELPAFEFIYGSQFFHLLRQTLLISNCRSVSHHSPTKAAQVSL